jgi:hypothetical protein
LFALTHLAFVVPITAAFASKPGPVFFVSGFARQAAVRSLRPVSSGHFLTPAHAPALSQLTYDKSIFMTGLKGPLCR